MKRIQTHAAVAGLMHAKLHRRAQRQSLDALQVEATLSFMFRTWHRAKAKQKDKSADRSLRAGRFALNATWHASLDTAGGLSYILLARAAD